MIENIRTYWFRTSLLKNPYKITKQLQASSLIGKERRPKTQTSWIDPPESWSFGNRIQHSGRMPNQSESHEVEVKLVFFVFSHLRLSFCFGKASNHFLPSPPEIESVKTDHHHDSTTCLEGSQFFEEGGFDDCSHLLDCCRCAHDP